MQGLVRLLRSASFARAVLVYLAVLCGVGAWLPWVRGVAGSAPPAWAEAFYLARPFSSPWFLAGVAALFASTLACTWGKRSRIAALWRGELPSGAVALGPAESADAEAFLRAQGFRGRGARLFRHRPALWGGLVLHWGLLALIAGVGIQQAFQDGGSFALAPGERKRLSDPGAVFAREAGPLAPRSPPAVEVTLLAFDPFRHQAGYAPDRLSVVELRRDDGAALTTEVDRADGIRLGVVIVYQAIPSGLGLVLETPRGTQVLHLESIDSRTARAQVGPPGREALLVVSSERPLDDRMGTGTLAARLEAGGGSRPLALGERFDLAGEPVRLVAWTRWAGFTYARSPGIFAVFAGFVLVLVGATLLTFPAGVALLPADGRSVALVWLGRGSDALRLEWQQRRPRGEEA